MEGGENMNKKALVILTMLAFSLMLTPIALAKPGAEKSNDKFVYFHLGVSGWPSYTYDRAWYTPPNVDPLENKTEHARGGGWFTWPGANLTVGTEIFRMDTTPYNITWTTTVDSNALRFNNGTAKSTIIKLVDVVTVYDGDNESIGTLVLILKSSIRVGVYSGNIVGYGTGAFEGVHISAIDLGVTFFMPGEPPTIIYERVGTITGWPEDITNTP
jgi:hypothetical protein